MSCIPESADDLDQLRRALFALQKMRARVDALEQARGEPIAIVGIGCRFPGGADGPEAFWNLLRGGVNAVSEVPRERWDANAYYDPDPNAPGKTVGRWGGFIRDVDQFDSHFFGVAPREAVDMDPQQRIVLEVTWEALEDAGIPPARLAGTPVGVFVGIGLNDYGRIQVAAQTVDRGRLTDYTVSGNALCITANRLSYLLDFRGPSVAVDTACSSSLVAIHLACQSLRNGESTIAVAGGVNLMLAPDNTIAIKKFLAPDGRCKFGDARADGYVRGEGVGIIVLKPLARALADGDLIYALIRGSAINQDGRSSGLTVPNGVAQQALLREAISRAGVEPTLIGYVEAHGTGTSLGDPIEAGALGEVLGRQRDPNHPLLIGSVKTNIGHLEAAAGIAGLIKVAMALRHGEIPPSLHFQAANPLIHFDELGLKVASVLTLWPENGSPRLAGVSSFGFGGTNAHAVLEAAPAPSIVSTQAERPRHVLTLSAKNDEALLALTQRFSEHLASRPDLSLADLCGTSHTCRTHFPRRLAVVAESLAEMRERLAAVGGGQTPPLVVGQEPRRRGNVQVAFLFTGQGSQYTGMGRLLYETQPTFRAALQECDRLLRPHLDRPLLSLLYPEPEMSTLLEQTAYTQPALFALEYALAQLWLSWGIKPAAVMGHSLGEYVAACVAGAVSLADGLRLVAERARLMQSLPAGGAMVAVHAGEVEVAAALAPYQGAVAIAAVNGPENVVISGSWADLQSVVERLRAHGVRTQRVTVSHAFHSSLVEPVLPALERAAAGVRFGPARLPLVSNLTGELCGADWVPDAAYWRRHAREAVRFSRGMETLHDAGCDVFLEIGPSPSLLAMGKRCLPDHVGTWLPSLRAGQNDWEQLLKSLAGLYTLGFDVDWVGFDRDYPSRRVSLPTYPFQRERYWTDSDSSQMPSLRALKQSESGHPLLGQRLRSPALKGIVFESRIEAGVSSFLADHRAYGKAVFPAAAYLEMALAAAGDVLGSGWHELADVVIQEALLLPEGDSRTVQLVVDTNGAEGTSFQVFSAVAEGATGQDNHVHGPTDSWRVHAAGTLRRLPEDHSAEQPTGAVALAAAQARCQTAVSVEHFYQTLRELGMQYGERFRGVAELWRGAGEAISRIRLPESLAAEAASYHVHPALLDACLQTLGATFLLGQPEEGGSLYLPVGIKGLRLLRTPGASVWAHASIREGAERRREALTGDVRLFDEAGQLLGVVEGLQLKQVTSERLARAGHAVGAARIDDMLYEVVWQRDDLAERQRAMASLPPGQWLIFADDEGAGLELATALRGLGESCVLAFPGRALETTVDGRWSLDPLRVEHFERLLRDGLGPDGGAWRGVVHLWNLYDHPLESGTNEARRASLDLGCASALHLFQALAKSGQAPLPRVWCVTRGAHRLSAGPDSVAVAQAPVWGLCRSVVLEIPELRCACLDLDPSLPPDNCGALLDEVLSGSGEDQVAFRAAGRFVARLAPRRADSGPDEQPSSDRPLRLTPSQRGLLDNLQLSPTERHAPGPGEVEIRVRATGLNFRDVLNALNMDPAGAAPLGGECAGIVVATGPGVEDLSVGQEVVALARDCFGTYVTTLASGVVPKPPSLTFTEAAALPIAFLTAHYGLLSLARLVPGETVLIHAAAGGVGLAAVRIAQRAGAVVFATAGSDEKRAYLRSLGVEHISDSRSLGFADDILSQTEGRGVDVVLNSLAGEFIPKSLSVLKPGGRFLEIGKRGIWSPAEVARLRPHAAYFVYDLGEATQRQPELIRAELIALLRDVVDGSLQTSPVRVFPLENAVAAFRHMAQAKHIGKIVVAQGDTATRPAQTFAIRSDATYLVTGGLGGLGLVVARWLVVEGARHLVLLGRTAPAPQAAETIAQLASAGVQVTAAAADISNEEDLARVLGPIEAAWPPVRGIVHAAGVLDDGVLLQQDWSRFLKVMAPKVEGGWLLHRMSQKMPLDFFVLFSAGAAILGSPGQSNYTAANAFLDALAHFRRSLGLPALSVNWGRWGAVGMAASLDQAGQARLSAQGVIALSPEQGVQALARLLRLDVAQAAVLPIDWPQYLRQFASDRQPPFLSLIGRREQAGAPAGELSTSADWLRQLTESPPNRRPTILAAHVRDQALKVLGLKASRGIDPRQPLNELGLDSLMAVELRNALSASVGRPLPATLLFDYPTIEDLTGFLLRELLPAEPPPASSLADSASESGSANAQSAADALACLSDDEAAALLLQELAEIKRDRK
ncbi:MAG: SDR family NAD(P)-dependent oxidoreductase [Chloroflexota bacterium]